VTYINPIDVNLPQALSSLVLCDQFLTLAGEAERAGFQVAAEHLVFLAIRIVEDPASLQA
jgi:hypothetical protein